MIKNLFFLSLIVGAQFGFASPKAQVPKELVSIIQAEEPNLKKTFLELNYKKSDVLKAYPKTKVENDLGTYVVGTKKLKWWFDKDENVKYFEIDFGLRSNSLYESEKTLFKQYRAELSPEALKSLSSATRTQVIKVPKSTTSFGVYFPVSDLKSPFIKSVVIEREGK